MKPLSQLKLTDKELELIIDALKDRIRHKGMRQLLSNINNQLEIEELYQKHRELQKDKELYENNYKKWANKSDKILRKIDEIKRNYDFSFLQSTLDTE
jgi:hypothetical protein